MRISDWSSDVCSSDLVEAHLAHGLAFRAKAMAPYDRAVRQNQHARGFVGRAFGVGNGHERPPSFSVVGGQTAGGLGSPRRPVNPVKSCQSALDWLFPHITRTVMIRDDLKAARRSDEHPSELK